MSNHALYGGGDIDSVEYDYILNFGSGCFWKCQIYKAVNEGTQTFVDKVSCKLGIKPLNFNCSAANLEMNSLRLSRCNCS